MESGGETIERRNGTGLEFDLDFMNRLGVLARPDMTVIDSDLDDRIVVQRKSS